MAARLRPPKTRKKSMEVTRPRRWSGVPAWRFAADNTNCALPNPPQSRGHHAHHGDSDAARRSIPLGDQAPNWGLCRRIRAGNKEDSLPIARTLCMISHRNRQSRETQSLPGHQVQGNPCARIGDGRRGLGQNGRKQFRSLPNVLQARSISPRPGRGGPPPPQRVSTGGSPMATNTANRKVIASRRIAPLGLNNSLANPPRAKPRVNIRDRSIPAAHWQSATGRDPPVREWTPIGHSWRSPRHTPAKTGPPGAAKPIPCGPLPTFPR